MANTRDINVMVKLGSLKNSIEAFGDNRFLIKTTLTDHNQINEELPKILAQKLGIPPHRLAIVNGLDNNIKNFRIVM